MRRLSREVREILVCPRCHGELEDAENASTAGESRAAGEIVGFACTVCRVTFPIEDGIPVLLLDATRAQESAGS